MRTPIRYQSEDMLEELFDEINDYLGAPTKTNDTNTNIIIPAKDRVERRRSTADERPSSYKQYKHDTSDDRPILVESDTEDDEASRLVPELSPTRATSLTPDTIADDLVSVSMCFRCKREKPHRSSLSLQSGGAHDSLCAECFQSTEVCASSASLANLVDLVKQTLSEKPQEVPSEETRHEPIHSEDRVEDIINSYVADSSSSNSPFSPVFDQTVKVERKKPRNQKTVYKNASPSSQHSYHHDVDLVGSVMRLQEMLDDQTDNSTILSFTEPITQATLEYEDQQQDCKEQPERKDRQEYQVEQGYQNDMEYASYSGHDGYDQDGAFNSSEPGHIIIPSDLPFLTPAYRVGEAHVAIKVRQVRDYATREDRMSTYNDAYYNCIMAKTEMIPWVRKQYNKGPPDTMFDYTPPPKKTSKKLFSMFKRSKPKDHLSDPNHPLHNPISSMPQHIPPTQFAIPQLPIEFTSVPDLSRHNSPSITSLVNSVDDKFEFAQRPKSMPATSSSNSRARISAGDMIPTSRTSAEPVSILKKTPSPVPSEQVAATDEEEEEPSRRQSRSRSRSGSRSRSSSRSRYEDHGYRSGRSLSQSDADQYFQNREVEEYKEDEETFLSAPVLTSPRRSLSPSRSDSMLRTSEEEYQRRPSLSPRHSRRLSRSSSRRRSTSSHHEPVYALMPPHPDEFGPQRRRRYSSSSRPAREFDHYDSASYHHRESRTPSPSYSHHHRESRTPSPSHSIHRRESRTPSPSRHHYHRESRTPSPSHYHHSRESHSPSPSRYHHQRHSRTPSPSHYHHMDSRGPSPSRLHRRTSSHSRYDDDMGRHNYSVSPARSRRRYSVDKWEISLDDLCAYFRHVERSVLANYLEDAHGDFFTAKRMCMDDIRAG